MNKVVDYTNVDDGELKQIIEQREALIAEKKELSDQIKEHKKETKASGYDNKIIDSIIKERARSAAAVAEEEALKEVYKKAIGME